MFRVISISSNISGIVDNVMTESKFAIRQSKRFWRDPVKRGGRFFLSFSASNRTIQQFAMKDSSHPRRHLWLLILLLVTFLLRRPGLKTRPALRVGQPAALFRTNLESNQAIAAGDLKIEGRREAFAEFTGLLDTSPFWFNIVTP